MSGFRDAWLAPWRGATAVRDAAAVACQRGVSRSAALGAGAARPTNLARQVIRRRLEDPQAMASRAPGESLAVGGLDELRRQLCGP